MTKLLIIISALILAGCYSVSNLLASRDKKITLYKSPGSSSAYLAVYKTIHPNCGCASVEVNKVLNGNVVFSMGYACTGSSLSPYLQIKQFDNSNNLVSKVCYRATATDNYDTPLTEEDQKMITLLDSLKQADKEQITDYKFCVKPIKGFNKIDCGN